MPWLRVGDNAATHPLVDALRDVRGSDRRLTCEVFGFVVMAATASAAHMTDGRITLASAERIAGSRTKPLTTAAVAAGLLTLHKEDGRTFWQLCEDPDFMHMRARDEIDWERQRKRDASNPNLIVPVRQRDGSACRYCGVIVNWFARKGARRGSYDHRVPGEPATVATYVVSCYSCQTKRSNDPSADERIPLLDAPANPYYCAATVAFLARHGVIVQPGSNPENLTETCQKPDRNPPGFGPGLTTERDTAVTGLERPGRVGSGRVGSGQVRSGQAGSGRVSAAVSVQPS